MATAGDDLGVGPERAYAASVPPAGEVALSREEAHHLFRVRRVGVGEEIVLFDGRGRLARARVLSTDTSAARIEVVGPYPARDPARPPRLAVAVPEPSRADGLVGGLAELGADLLLPLLYARTPPEREALVERRRSRWTRLAREALKVNGRSRALEVLPVETFAGWIAGPFEARILLDPDPALPTLPAVLPAAGPIPWLVIGPEGGFTDAERDSARGAGAEPARLGLPALRTATAGLAAAAVALAR